MKKLGIVLALTLTVVLVGAMLTTPASALFGRGKSSTVTYCVPAVCVPLCGVYCAPACYPVYAYPPCPPAKPAKPAADKAKKSSTKK